MAWHHEVAWWVGTALVAIVAVLLFRIIGARIPFRPLQTLAAAA